MNMGIARMGSTSSVCFSFGLQVWEDWILNLMSNWIWNVGIAWLGPKSSVCFNLECKYCKVGLGLMSNVDLSNWHVDIANGTFTFLMLLLLLACKYCQPRFHA
jgi:hypothetical protein